MARMTVTEFTAALQTLDVPGMDVESEPGRFVISLWPPRPNGTPGDYAGRVTFRFDEGVLSTFWWENVDGNVHDTDDAVHWLEEVGADGLRTVLVALVGGVRTREGLTEVQAGTPVEWARAFENDSAT